MPVKIGFQVVSCSGEDDRYRVNELNYHGPTVRGWRSSFNCQFPQEIVLRLDVFVVVQQIQILVHQYLIPRKIEIWTSEDEDKDLPSESSPDRFQYLGFITFSDNKATGFRSRELKSILIPSINAIKLIKLRIHENHVNNKNIFNQVGIMGINILGDEIDNKVTESEYNNNVFCRWNSMYPSTASQNSNYISPYDDLAFEMYVDEETAKIIKILVQKKQQAVFDEDFERANILKITLENLRAAGEVLGLYEQEKKQAIQMEDFDRAKLKKMQIADFREKVYSTLNINFLLNQSENDEHAPQPHPDNINNANVIESAFHNVAEINYSDKDLDNGPTFQKSSFFKTNTGYSHLIHSKSQFAFSNLKDSTSETQIKNQSFKSSASNPQLHQYLKEAQHHNLWEKRRTEENEQPKEPDYECDGTTSPITDSSDSEESAIFNGFPSENRDYSSLPILPSEEKEQGTKNKNETLNSLKWNEIQTPTEVTGRSRSRIAESSRVRSKSMTTGTVKSSFEAYEDRMLPALKNYHGNEVVRECQLAVDHQTKTILNERERKQALLPISVFGIEMIEKFYSKSFNDKEEGIRLLQQELRKIIESGEGSNGIMCGSHNKMARAAIFLLHRALRDKVYSVYSGAAETIRLFFAEFVPQRVSSSEVARSVEKLLPELLTKSGDVTPRIHNMAAHTVLSMAECEEVRRLNIIPIHLSRPLMSSVHPRLALSRLEMVEQLILNHGISKDKKSGLTCRTLAEFGSSGLHHPAEAVRKVSERILIHVYKVNPRMVRKQLPPDDNVTRRNLLYRQLFQEFDFMDIQRKMMEQENEEANAKVQTSERQYLEPSSERKAFCIINNNNHNNNYNQQEDINKKWTDFDSQLKTIKNFMALNLGEKNGNRPSSQKQSVNPPTSKNNERIYNEIQTDLAPKQSFRFDAESKAIKKSIPNSLNNRKFEKKSNSNTRSTNQNAIEMKEARVKFPCLTDSIDTTRARLIFGHKKSTKTKKVDHVLPKKEPNSMGTEIKIPLKNEPKENVNFPSGIPLPTSGFSKKHYNSIKKLPVRKIVEETPSHTAPSKTKTLIPRIKPLGKFFKNSFESSEVGKTTIFENEKKESFSRTERHMETSNLQTPVKNFEKINRFSESMLASIKENELLECPLSVTDLDNKRTSLKTCIFCLSSDKWTTDDSLKQHYLTNCPMLTTCEYCTEVIEISGFNNHLLDECTQKHLFSKCCTCHQPLLADLLSSHECTGSPNGSHQTKCPFCHEDIGENDISWRNHFMGKNVCTNHPRPPQQHD